MDYIEKYNQKNLEERKNNVDLLLYGGDKRYGFNPEEDEPLGLYEKMESVIAKYKKQIERYRDRLYGRSSDVGEKVAPAVGHEASSLRRDIAAVEDKIKERTKLFNKVRQYVELYERTVENPIDFKDENIDKQFFEFVNSLGLSSSVKEKLLEPLRSLQKEILKERKSQKFDGNVKIARRDNNKEEHVDEYDFEQAMYQLFSRTETHITSKINNYNYDDEVKLNDSVVVYLENIKNNPSEYKGKLSLNELEKLLIERKQIIDNLKKIKYCTNALMTNNNSKKFENLMKDLQRLKANYEKNLKKTDRKLNSSGLSFEQIDARGKAFIEEERKKRERESAIYAYAKILDDLNKTSDYTERMNLQNQLENIKNKYNLDIKDIRKAESINTVKKDEQIIKDNEREKEKREREDKDIQELKIYREALEEVRREMALSGWRPREEIPLKNGEINFVEEEKAFSAEAKRRADEITRAKMAEMMLNDMGKNQFSDSRETVGDVQIKLEQAVEERSKADIKVLSEEKLAQMIEYYESTIDMSRDERALETLILEGRVPKNSKLDELNIVQKQILEAQKRLEEKISTLLEKKKKYIALDEEESKGKGR